MISRNFFIDQINEAFHVNPCVAILGPRQCGKTTLALNFALKQKKKYHHFDLEDPADYSALKEAKFVLDKLNGLIIIDEVQRYPDLFPILRILIDQKKRKCQFLILGSASHTLIEKSAETLAGRISHVELTPFSTREVPSIKKIWQRGGYPLSYLAKSDEISFKWRYEYIRTFLEHDIPQLGIQIPAETLRRFWMMLTHYHGQIFNASEIGKSLGLSHTTARRYLDILTGTLMIRVLPPWFENLKKREIKSPKVFFRDSGIFHSLLGLHHEKDILVHPKLGASWEGFALEEIIRKEDADGKNSFFWGIHRDAELDLLIHKNGKRYGYEVKFSRNSKLMKRQNKIIEMLKLEKLYLVNPGKKNLALSDKITSIGLEKLLSY